MNMSTLKRLVIEQRQHKVSDSVIRVMEVKLWVQIS